MPKLTVLVGPPGSGKSTWAKSTECGPPNAQYVNQDSQGKEGHMETFNRALAAKEDIVVDRMGFSRDQRRRYLEPAKQVGYQTEIVVLHQPYDVCLERMKQRQSHPTIKDEETAKKALHFFFTKHERVEEPEADTVTRIWPDGEKLPAIICDLDGTLCDCEHRRHHVRKPDGQRKDWRSFFLEMSKDPVIWPVHAILHRFQSDDIHAMNIVFCSGRPEDYRELTKTWLKETGLHYSALYMRSAKDSRQDDIVKEILLDFEILTRFKPYFILDDRDQVVRMWRKRGFTCLQCAEGNF